MKVDKEQQERMICYIKNKKTGEYLAKPYGTRMWTEDFQRAKIYTLPRTAKSAMSNMGFPRNGNGYTIEIKFIKD